MNSSKATPVLSATQTFSLSERKEARAHLAMAEGEFLAADRLIDVDLHREAYIHLWRCHRRISDALLIRQETCNVPDDKICSILRDVYGAHSQFPPEYLDLQDSLRKTCDRFELSFLRPATSEEVIQKSQLVRKYFEFAHTQIRSISPIEIVAELWRMNRSSLQGLSFDTYWPGDSSTELSSSDCVRQTVWIPKRLLSEDPEELTRKACAQLQALDVPDASDYVVGLNSHLDKQHSVNLLLLDLDSLALGSEAALDNIGGTLLRSGRGFHFIGNHLILGNTAWRTRLNQLKKTGALKQDLDQSHIDASLERGYSTLRLTASPLKPEPPYFIHELPNSQGSLAEFLQ